MMNNEMKIVYLEGIYNMKMVGLGKIFKWFKEILISVGSEREIVADIRERDHKM
jgi:hypothetical protein